MKTVRIKELKLRNFKGVKEFTLDLNGGNASIYGDNGTGKTTIFDAVCWLFFDKDSSGKTSFEIKTLSFEGEALHGLEHEVEAVLDVDGRGVKLRKVLVEKWTKKRGSASSEFTGHTTSYYVDDIPVQLKDYRDAIERIASEEMFKLLTSPIYFNEQLHWTKRRETLLDVCGDISDADVIESDSSLKSLPAILKGRKLEDHRKVIVARRKEVNGELQNIPVRISEVNRNMPDINGISAEIEQGIVAATDESLQSERGKLLQAESGGAVAEKRVELQEIESEIMALKNEYQFNVRREIEEAETDKRAVSSQIEACQTNSRHLTEDIKLARETINHNTNEMNRLRVEYNQVYAEKLQYEQNDTCPTCGQPLPEDQLQVAREKALADFNRMKSEKLEKINDTGKSLKTKVVELEQSVKNLQPKLDICQEEYEKLTVRLGNIGEKILNLETRLGDYTTSMAYKRASSRAETIKQEIANLQQGQQANTEPIKQRIKDLEKDKEDAQSKLLLLKQAEASKERIKELDQQERDLAAEYERLERELYLTEQFVKSKVSLLESKINSKFKLARFKLFSEQINGGLTEVCETTFQGVPYSTGLNHGSRINVGLDIINTLSIHYGISLPIFVDNSESVTHLIGVDNQVIMLVVSEQDKKLRIEAGSARPAEKQMAGQMALV